MEELIERDRLFTFRELGFANRGKTHLGDLRREVILLVEEDSLEGYVERLASQFG